MIVGTAGHIDHGKTALVRALTGVDTDRLPEEKRRGISIELGYAFLDLPGSGRIGFVDVPGHERLVHTMLAGASGIDVALFVVAADDGPMPQTLEHLAVLSLLGVEEGCVALTKIDRVDEARVREVEQQVGKLVEGTPLHDAPIVRTSVVTGSGIETLREWLAQAAARRVAALHVVHGFRMPIDRVFTVKGAGTVVTGSGASGRVRAGDELAVVPGGSRVRVRSLHVNGQPAASGGTGERIALQIAGLSTDQVARGQWLCDPAVAIETDRVDARLTVWQGERSALRVGTTVHLHHGTSDIVATVAMLEDRRDIAPGETAFVQLVLRERSALWRGDRMVLRDASAQRTVAGARVLDPAPPRRYRRTPQRLALLAAHAQTAPAERLREAIRVSADGVDLRGWSRSEAWVADPPLPSEDAEARNGFVIAPSHLAHAGKRLIETMAGFHERFPDQPGIASDRARRMVAPSMPAAGWDRVVAREAQAGRLTLRGPLMALAAHDTQLSLMDERIAHAALPHIVAGGLDPPWLRAIAKHVGEPESALRGALVRMARRGELHQVVPDLFYAHAVMAPLAQAVRELAAQHGAVTAAQLRDRTGLRRKRAVQVLEYFDRIGLLHRVGDAHKLRPGADAFT